MNAWRTATAAAVILSAVGTGVTVAQTQPQTQPPANQSQPGAPMMAPMMNDGMGDGRDMPFRHHHHRGHGMREMGMGMPCAQSAAITPETVSQRLTQRLERRGNPRVKLGAVTQGTDGLITAEIVTVKEGALVDRFAVDPKSGRWQRVE